MSTALGGAWAFVAVGITILPLLFAPTAFARSGIGAGYLAIEAPVILLLISTMTFRERDAAALASNPLDAAGLYRVGCVGIAALLGWAALTRPAARVDHVRMPIAIGLYAAYIAVVFLGAAISINPKLTAYRGVELATGLLVVLAAVRFGGRNAIERLERLLYWFIVLLILVVWSNVLLFPGRAIIRDIAPLPFQIQALYPVVASNGIGSLGVLLTLWSLGRLMLGERVNRRLSLAMVALGVATLVAAQYRTGYIALAAGLGLLLLARGKRVLAIVALSVVLVAGIWGVRSQAEPFLLRGQSRDQASQLSGRLEYWEHAIPVWERSPLIGRGLVTATRFEVLAPLGATRTSTIHSTWVEALVGTGVVGVGILGMLLLSLWRQAIRELLRPGGLAAPALLLAAVTIETVTTTTFEIFGFGSILVLVLAFRLAAAPHRSVA